jgi:hypothetical protein
VLKNYERIKENFKAEKNRSDQIILKIGKRIILIKKKKKRKSKFRVHWLARDKLSKKTTKNNFKL